MATQAQIEANRRNTQKSTGPKTTEGKARVSLNALKHGLRACVIVDQLQRTPLWDEDPHDFADLVQSLVDQFQPEGLYEEICVEDVAICHWRLRRVARAATAGSGGLHSSNEATKTGYIAGAQRQVLDGPGRDNPRLHARRALPDLDEVEKLNRYETSIRRQLDRSLATLEKLQTRRREATTAPAQRVERPSSIFDGPSRTNYYERTEMLRHSASDLASSPAPNDDILESRDLPNKANPPAGPATSETATGTEVSQSLAERLDAMAPSALILPPIAPTETAILANKAKSPVEDPLKTH